MSAAARQLPAGGDLPPSLPPAASFLLYLHSSVEKSFVVIVVAGVLYSRHYTGLQEYSEIRNLLRALT